MNHILSKSVRWMFVVVLAVACAACAGADARKVSYLQRGQKYFDEQNYDKARVEVRNAMQIDPHYADARYLAGRISEKKNDIRDAAGQYQGALDENPKFSAARAALARLYVFAGLQDKGLELAESGLKDEPNNAALLTVRGLAQARAGRIVPALEDAEAAYKIAPNDEFTISLLASLYKQSARSDKAIEVVSRAVQQLPKSVDLRVVLADLQMSQQHYDEAEQALKQVIQIEPKVLTHRTRLTQFYLYRKDTAKAEATWREAVAAVPDNADAKVALVDLLWSQQGEEVATKEMQTLIGRDSGNSALKLALGRYLEKQGKTEGAAKFYQEVIDKEGKEADGLSARDRLAALELRRGNGQHAETLVGEVLKENQRDNDALILRANMAMQRGETATAITDLRTVLRDQPNSAPLMRALAAAHLQNNELSLAEETLRNALQANPGDVETQKSLAQLMIREGKADQAKPILEQIADTRGIDDNFDLLNNLFQLQLTAKDFAAAQGTAEKVQTLKPKSALGWYMEGMLAEVQQKKDVARRQYEHALELQPELGEPLTALVRMDLADKQEKRALERIDKAIAANPKNSGAYNVRGEILAASKQWQASMDAFNQAINLAPAWAQPYKTLALVQFSQKQNDAAVTTLQNGIDKTKNASLYTDLASLYEHLGKTDDAIKVYERLLTADPKSLLAANNLAMLLLNYRSDQPSVQRAAKLAEGLSTSDNPALLDTRGWAKFKAGDFPGALPLLERAAKTPDTGPLVRYHLGMAQLKTGNKTGARDNLNAAVNSGQQFIGLDEAKKALAELGKAS